MDAVDSNNVLVIAVVFYVVARTACWLKLPHSIFNTHIIHCETPTSSFIGRGILRLLRDNMSSFLSKVYQCYHIFVNFIFTVEIVYKKRIWIGMNVGRLWINVALLLFKTDSLCYSLERIIIQIPRASGNWVLCTLFSKHNMLGLS